MPKVMVTDPLEQALIDEFMSTHGVTKCVPGAAVLGESTPGWRRQVERKVELGGIRSQRRQQATLQGSAIARCPLPFVVCRYGNLVGWVRPAAGQVPASKYAKQLNKRFAKIGAEFSISISSAKDKNIDWSRLKKVLKRALEKSKPILVKKGTEPSLVSPLVMAWPKPRASGRVGKRGHFVQGFHVSSSGFLTTNVWRELRYEALERHGARCQCCGAVAGDAVRIEVDHIKSRSEYPELATDPTNLQVLCGACNMGKGNRHSTDWRSPAT